MGSRQATAARDAGFSTLCGRVVRRFCGRQLRLGRTSGGRGYPHDEAYFLGCILHLVEATLRGHPELEAREFEDWLRIRRRQGRWREVGGMWRISWIIVGVWVGLRVICPQNRRCRCVDGDRKSQHELLSSPKYHAARRLSLKRNSPLQGYLPGNGIRELWLSRCRCPRRVEVEGKTFNQPKQKVTISRRSKLQSAEV